MIREIKFFIYIFMLIITNFSRSEEKITTPLINIDEIKPFFEELDDKNESLSSIKIKKMKILNHLKLS